MSTSLRPLRMKLTLWYLLTLCGIIVLLGGGLFLAIGHRFTAELDESLRGAAAQLEGAARTRELESGARGKVVDAVEELQITDRALYLFDTTGVAVTPAAAPAAVYDAVRQLGHAASIDREAGGGREQTLKIHAERFTLASGRAMIAVAVANKVELEDRYAALITAFGAAALFALIMVAIGGWLLVRQATAPIEASMAQMRRFMADAAHELRTPIAVLRARADVTLQRERDGAAYVEALHAIESESRRLGRIVDDLLTLARADAGERPPTLSPMSLDDVVMDAVGAAGAMATGRGISLALGECSEVHVQGDRELLRQLVMILLDNAIKFTRPGGRVRVTVNQVNGEGAVSVEDNGPGIGADQIPHIFERFYRGDGARPRADLAFAASASGAGLGLSIARWIADTHRARVTVDSAVTVGTTVSVRFPAMSSS